MPEPDPERDSAPSPSGLAARWGSRGTVLVIALGAIVLLAIGATLGVALAPQRQGQSEAPNSVDVGFAQDMIRHHSQAVTMANYAERNTSDPEIENVAFDINYTQTAQLGEMEGWLALWGQPEINPGTPMDWMTAGDAGHHAMAAVPTSGATGPDSSLMPGMATAAEMDKLKSLHGKESDIFFLQLMIRHHQGGSEMMEYAVRFAGNSVVRNFAGKMAQTQGDEISRMTQMLALRGGSPLPPPAGYTPPVATTS